MHWHALHRQRPGSYVVGKFRDLHQPRCLMVAFTLPCMEHSCCMSIKDSLRPVNPTSSLRHVALACTPPRLSPDNALIVGLVGAMTESLRLLGVGRERYEAAVASALPARRLRQGDVGGVMDRIRADFKQGYIVTGACRSWVCKCTIVCVFSCSRRCTTGRLHKKGQCAA
jgi:hypothetical protein